MKIEFDIFNRKFFRTLTFSLKFQKKAQVSIIYMKNIVFLLIFKSMAIVKDAKGISFKNRLKGHINWRTSDFHAVLFWFVYDTSAVRRPIITIEVSLKRKIT
jgi:hypothetical protein